ncbi:sulfide-dependent adenosine diphosphate thiazole synthase [Methanococcoides seepicolus]|uniref:Thiamine thiazole synthase n=1 Tax=Methanococcoides seepicolus TaxID=2828780 RepID=A0A9E4ZFF8_9EURY|nr:sulfide-dependent adenosine diphosphate thiazole synthase [Methanococcoides seepicolus]MCM1986611.1 sulfide-dependent adenosine diphosphate thiazole synthase [Methanococcoides seepicolus]
MNQFAQATEKDITRSIVEEFLGDFLNHIESDVIIVGGGPSGLVAARDLASKGIKTVVLESNNYFGGGFWLGGYLMNKVTVRAPAQRIFDQLGVPYKEVPHIKEGLYVADAPSACSKLISAACDAGAFMLNMNKFDDVVLRDGRVSGAVTNWTPVSALPRAITCVDPVAIEAKCLIDATGHDAVVANSLASRGLVDLKGFSGMDVDNSEDAVVNNTSEIFPGLVVTGMAAATCFGLSRMGPTFGGMLESGIKAAKIAEAIVKSV